MIQYEKKRYFMYAFLTEYSTLYLINLIKYRHK